MKIITIVGTRPELIRLSRIIDLLDKYTNHVLVHTGQNYDYELNEIFFKDLGIRKPNHLLEVNTSSLGSVIGNVIIKSESILLSEKPDAVLILGDTNSSLACIMAKRLKIPIYHIEAGNRSFDSNTPEEINRKIIDHIADFNLVYTEHARRNLLSEGLSSRRIYLIGSPMGEILDFYKDKILKSIIQQELELNNQEYFLVSIHREENVDNQEKLKTILQTINMLVGIYDYPVIVSTHPRTKDRIKKLNYNELNEKIKFLKPFGYFDYIQLQKHAKCVISDSGTISEEAAILSIPAITIRESMERPEAMDCGNIILTGIDTETILKSIELQMNFSNFKTDKIPYEYTIKDCSSRVLKIILGTTKLSNKWNGIIKNEN